ncbi:glycosyltransferase [Flavobacterium sp. SM2513]|uniref:glycosyltransferase n=1 Tax=Flavobacterium sp. SM2513 TaxID=3424766 RepID=UPI003D7FC706
MSLAPLVSISCITYNHVNFIRECLDGFLMQKCNFDFEILIHDDASTDGTSDIIREYYDKYPNIIKPIIQVENQWSRGIRKMTLTFNIPRAQGKYIAMCEGDDYWTDPLKLQKQVNFLENNTNYVLVGNLASKIYESENFNTLHKPKIALNCDFDFDTKYLMLKNPISTLTVCFRNGLIKEFPEVYFQGSGGDRRLYMLLSQFGKCRYTQDVSGVYRIHSGGITNQHKGSYLKRIKGYEEYIKNTENWNTYFDNKYSNELLIAKHHYSVKIVELLFKNKMWHKTKPYLSHINFTDLNFRTKIIYLLLKINSFLGH